MAPGPNTTFIAGMVFLGLFVIAGGVWGGYRLQASFAGPAEAKAPLLGGQQQQNQRGYDTGARRTNEEDLHARLAALDGKP